EPLANIDAIEAVCAFLDRKVSEGQLARLPQFVATTNGTYSEPKVIELLKRRNIGLTVSWDGPSEVHDAARPSVGGASTFNKVRKSLDRFHASGIRVDIECTYNRNHLQHGITVVDLMNYFYNEAGKKVTHISPAFLPQSKDQPEGQQIFRGEALERES